MSSAFILLLIMNDFRYVDYDTVYSCSGELIQNLSHRACFGYVFRSDITIKSDIKYTVVLYRGLDYCKENGKSNACLFSIKEVRNHLRSLKSLYKFHYRVTSEEDEYPKIIVHLRLNNVPPTFHKYVLTWLRYTYEFPYNVFLKDAYNLKSIPEFRFESISNIFNLVLGCYCNDLRIIHQVPHNFVSKPLKISELKERIKEVKELNNIYRALNPKNETIPKKIGEYDVCDIEYWESGFDSRKPVYLEVYNKIKDKK